MDISDDMISATYKLCTMRLPGLGEFPVTSLSETELFEKFAVPQADSLFKDTIFICGTFKLLAE